MSDKWLMSLDTRMDLAFCVEAISIPLRVRFFSTSTPKSCGEYREYTPFNKGSLWKIRYYPAGHFKVFYGTQEKAYCSTLVECLKITNNN